MVSRIAELIAERKVTRVRAAPILGVPQPKVSALLRSDFTGFSLERPFYLMFALDNGVSIVVAPKRAEYGPLIIVARRGESDRGRHNGPVPGRASRTLHEVIVAARPADPAEPTMGPTGLPRPMETPIRVYYRFLHRTRRCSLIEQASWSS